MSEELQLTEEQYQLLSALMSRSKADLDRMMRKEELFHIRSAKYWVAEYKKLKEDPAYLDNQIRKLEDRLEYWESRQALMRICRDV